MTVEARVIGVLVDPTEKEDWVAELRRQIRDQGLSLVVDPDAAPAQIDYLVYNIDSGMFDFAPYTKLRAILNTWAGVEAVVKTVDWPDHIPFVRMVEDGMTIGMVEYFLANTLRYHLDIDRNIAQSAQGLWQKFMPPLARDRVVGILGLGALGAEITQRLAANGFQVHGWSRAPKEIPGVTCHHGPDGLRDCLSVAQILGVILPLTPQTENLLDAETLAMLPRGACLINAGRGPLIDDTALLDTLASGQVRHATLDVFRTEPLPDDHAFWRHPQITVTPHIAASTRFDTGVASILTQIGRDMDQQPFLHIVDRTHGY